MGLFETRSRARNIFGQAGDEVSKPYRNIFFGDTSLDEPEEENPIKRATRRLLEMLSEPSQANERYNKYLEEQPDEAKYQPSKKRRLGGALAAGLIGLTSPETGVRTGDKIINKPFDDAVRNWERKRQPLQNAATSENANRTAKVNLLKEYIQAEHQNALDESLIRDRREDNERSRRTLDETIRANNARELETKTEHERTEKNRNEDNARADKTFKESQTQHAWERQHGNTMANVANRNADSTAIRATAYASSITGLNAYRDFLKTKVTNAKGPTKQTKELAELNTIMKPGNSQRYADFWSQAENGKIFIKPPSTDDTDTLLEWAAFQKEIEDEHNKIVTNNKSSSSNKTDNNKPKTNISIVRRDTTPSSR